MRLIEVNKRARGIFEWTSIRKHLHNALILLIEYRVHGLHFEYYIFYLMLGEIRLQYEPEQRAQSTFKVWVNLGVFSMNSDDKSNIQGDSLNRNLSRSIGLRVAF